MGLPYRQPGLGVGETEPGGRAGPGHGRAGAVARQGQRPVGDRLGILQILERDIDLRQAQFLAIIKEDIAAQAGQQQHLHPAIGMGVDIAGPARNGARRVMIFERPARPADALLRRPARQRGLQERGGQPGGVEEVEAIGGVEAMIALGEGLHLRIAVIPADFGDGKAIGIFVEHRTHLFQEQRNVRVALAVALDLEIIGARADATILRCGRIVAQLRVGHRMVDRIDAEAVDAAVEPEADNIQHSRLHLSIVQVDLRLLLQEIVHIILAAPRVPGPGRAAEHRLPVVGRRAVGLGIGPDIPVGMVVLAAGAAFDEPGMFVGGVGPDLIDDDAQAEVMGAGDQRVEIGERAEDRIDIAIIRHVIAEVAHRALEEGREPDGVDAERGDIGKMGGDAGQIADAVAIGVGEAARIDLVDGGAAPPGSQCVGHCGLALRTAQTL